MLVEQDPEEPRVRKRQPNAANRMAREAIRLVQNSNARIAEWQMALARHSANAERLTRRGEDCTLLEAALLALRMDVASERANLDRVIAAAPGEVTANSRVADSRRALELIDLRIGTLLRGLPPAEG